MTIDKLGPVDPVPKFNKTERISKPANVSRSDSISFSSEAKSMGEVYKATQDVQMAPEIREDRVAEVRRKLQDPSYIDRKVIEDVAEKVMTLFKI